jgi:hypothetical protein
MSAPIIINRFALRFLRAQEWAHAREEGGADLRSFFGVRRYQLARLLGSCLFAQRLRANARNPRATLRRQQGSASPGELRPSCDLVTTCVTRIVPLGLAPFPLGFCD